MAGGRHFRVDRGLPDGEQSARGHQILQEGVRRQGRIQGADPDGKQLSMRRWWRSAGISCFRTISPSTSPTWRRDVRRAKGSITVHINLKNPLEVDGAIARARGRGRHGHHGGDRHVLGDALRAHSDPYGYVWAFGAPLPLGALTETPVDRLRSHRHRHRPRRLRVRHPRGPARHEGRRRREARDARRHLPQRRLHPLEGAAARVRALRGGGPRLRRHGHRRSSRSSISRRCWPSRTRASRATSTASPSC